MWTRCRSSVIIKNEENIRIATSVCFLNWAAVALNSKEVKGARFVWDVYTVCLIVADWRSDMSWDIFVKMCVILCVSLGFCSRMY